MLQQIIKVINTWFAHYNQENNNDFNRNVMTNIISNIFIPTPPSTLIIRIYKNKSVVGVILFSLNLEYDKPVFVIIV